MAFMNKDAEQGPKILSRIILEVIGKPPEHLIETLKTLIKEMSEEKGITIKEDKIYEPQLIKDQKELHTTFAEIEIETVGMLPIIIVLFKYMPSHVEIISPEHISLDNHSWNEALNETTRRLHGYDEVARVIQNENAILEKRLKDLTEKQ